MCAICTASFLFTAVLELHFINLVCWKDLTEHQLSHPTVFTTVEQFIIQYCPLQIKTRHVKVAFSAFFFKFLKLSAALQCSGGFITDWPRLCRHYVTASNNRKGAPWRCALCSTKPRPSRTTRNDLVPAYRAFCWPLNNGW